MRGLSVALLSVLVFGHLASFQVVSGRSYHKNSKIPKDEYYAGRDAAIDDAEDVAYWTNLGLDEIQSSLRDTSVLNSGIAKNVIIFVGDGMSIPTLTAARIYKAQKVDNDYASSEKAYLSFERFPHVALSKTYDIDYQIADSASTASAMFSGVKTKYYSLGYDSHIDNNNVSSSLTAKEVTTIMTWAQEAGKDTGIVTTARITHATPAAMYAHVYDRDWECDTMYWSDNQGIPPPEDLHDIAWQLVNREPGNKAKVMLGGGAPAFYPKEIMEDINAKFPASAVKWDECYRNDTLNLAEQWLSNHGSGAKLVMSRDELLAVDAAETDYLLGLLGLDHVEYDDLRNTTFDPTIAEMTEKALEVLRKGPNGFFLLVEGGRIDHAHHDTLANRALSETLAFDKTVERVLEIMKDQLDETLIIVTADHAHTMSINGYAKRGNDITGLNGMNLHDGLPYTTLTYANGLGYYNHNIVSEDRQNVTRWNLTGVDVTGMDFTQASAGFRDSETHGGDDVAIFAKGPMSHLFHRTHDQSYIAYVMAYSSCSGPYLDDPRCPIPSGSSRTGVTIGTWGLLLLLLVVISKV